MAKLELAPVHIIIKYAWWLLKTNDPDTWNESNYQDGIVPIVPLGEEPEITDSGHPFIVYGHSTQRSRVHGQKFGIVSLSVRDTNYRRLVRTMNILEGGFERQDETATDLNRYSTSMGSAYIGIRFGSVNLGYSEGPSPAISEGGRQQSVMSIEYVCYVDYGSKLKTSTAS